MHIMHDSLCGLLICPLLEIRVLLSRKHLSPILRHKNKINSYSAGLVGCCNFQNLEISCHLDKHHIAA
jgi:hypothetical protein